MASGGAQSGRRLEAGKICRHVGGTGAQGAVDASCDGRPRDVTPVPSCNLPVAKGLVETGS